MSRCQNVSQSLVFFHRKNPGTLLQNIRKVFLKHCQRKLNKQQVFLAHFPTEKQRQNQAPNSLIHICTKIAFFSSTLKGNTLDRRRRLSALSHSPKLICYGTFESLAGSCLLQRRSLHWLLRNVLLNPCRASF